MTTRQTTADVLAAARTFVWLGKIMRHGHVSYGDGAFETDEEVMQRILATPGLIRDARDAADALQALQDEHDDEREVRESRGIAADIRTVHSGAPVSLVEYHEALRRLREAAAGGDLVPEGKDKP